jgi:hypothetical protein
VVSGVTLPQLAQPTLLVLGAGFLAANLKVSIELIRYRRRRRTALLVWPRPRPAYYQFGLLLGVVQALLLASFIVLRRPPPQVFSLAMMLVYFLGAIPLSVRIDRGFYRDGVWADTSFVPWARISAVSWKEDPVTLVLVSSVRSMAQNLRVPKGLYGEARKVLRDRIGARDLQLRGLGLDLGMRDERDTV